MEGSILGIFKRTSVVFALKKYSWYNYEKHGTKLGEDKLSQLVTALLDDGLVDVVRQVASDAKVREEYYKKYGIQ